MSRNKRGSNQYELKPRNNFYVLYWYLFAVILVVLFCQFVKALPKAEKAQAQLISPLPTKMATVKLSNEMEGVKPGVVALTPTPTLTSEQEQIRQEIKEVFGKHYNRAILLLQGDPSNPKCPRGENHEFDPNAVNDNTKWGGLGRDWGVFQINDYWQGVTNTAFLTDYKINIRLAYSIFERSNYTFKMWTCGKVLGI